ncbi:MAG: hypothetical protein IPN53_23890 [Comamonadaceae bacterium]|nr:hypothetical protein [Comamonadaceae bacterium]
MAQQRQAFTEVERDTLGLHGLLPPLANTCEMSAQIAVAVAEVAFQRGLASRSQPENMLDLVRAHVCHHTTRRQCDQVPRSAVT